MASFSQCTINLILVLITLCSTCRANDILGCGGFVKSHVSLDFSKIEIGLYTKEGSLKEKTECAPTNGYYFLPLYEKGEYVLKVHPPAGWSFEPSQVSLIVDGATDQCSSGQDINFSFNGFGITGRVITAGQKQGPAGINVQLVNDKGEVRDTVTTHGGDFHFTPVIPGKYTVKASHSRWVLEPSQSIVQVKEGNTALPIGVLAVKGYDVTGTVTSFGSPISGVYVLLYSKEDSPKFRVEGCNTALLQAVPDAPICHSITDSNGEFKFGLVPAGEYKLLALPTSPGQVALTYNVKPAAVPFTVRHDSLFIKNAFEVTGFTVVGSVIKNVGGPGISGVRVLLDGEAIGNTDTSGKFTLPNLQPATYTVGFQHEQCEIDDMVVSVGNSGPRAALAARAARWRVCGSVVPASRRQVLLTRTGGDSAPAQVLADPDWCLYLPPALYTAHVHVTEQDHRDGLQFYPLSQKVSVGNAPVEGITFSQLKGKLTGVIQCKEPSACANIKVTLRPLSADGGYVGQPVSTVAVDGKYTFEEVLPGSVEISVESSRLCWAEARHNVAVTQDLAHVPTFEHTGYVINIHSTHEVEVEYKTAGATGLLNVGAGLSSVCVPLGAQYVLTPRGCHRFQPDSVRADTSKRTPDTVYLKAVAHSVVIKVTSPDPAQDLMLQLTGEGLETGKNVGPLVPLQQPSGPYVYEHTIYMTDGEVLWVSATSESLLVWPARAQLVGAARCQPDALVLRARRALTLAGKLQPPVPGVTITLTADDVKQIQTTTEDGTYRFGPLDASKRYTVVAEKESYVFSTPDDNGDIVAHKLAEITVLLTDEADDTPLQGALVSVSGGTYRRNVVSGADGRLRFASLSPAQYYVKPNMKEYRFQPPHHIVTLQEGKAHHVQLKGVRVAWSCVGRLVSLGGAGWRGAQLLAVPRDCATTEEATTEPSGAFRIRGLLPNCVYDIQLKNSTIPELAGLKLARAPPVLEVKDKKDIGGVSVVGVVPVHTTDGSVRVRAARASHYRTLRLTLAPHGAAGTARATHNMRVRGAEVSVLPRLPVDGATYVLTLDSSLSKLTHHYPDHVYYFVSDGRYKHFDIDFTPQVKGMEQEVGATSVLALPLLLALGLAYFARDRLLALLTPRVTPRPTRASPPATTATAPNAPASATLIKRNNKKPKLI